MQLADLKLRSLSFELRYPNAYRLWDCSGEIWGTVSEKWPSIKMGDASPNVTKFNLDQNTEFAIHIDKCSVVVAIVDAKTFIEYSEFITHLVRTHLEVKVFDRIGMRQVYLKEFKSREEAAIELIKTKRTSIPQGKNFGIDGKLVGGDFSIKVEGDALGYLARVFVQSKKISFHGPIGEQDLPPIDKERHEFGFDLDYYTVAPTPAGQLKPKDWIEQALHVARRDAKIVLEPAP